LVVLTRAAIFVVTRELRRPTVKTPESIFRPFLELRATVRTRFVYRVKVFSSKHQSGFVDYPT